MAVDAAAGPELNRRGDEGVRKQLLEALERWFVLGRGSSTAKVADCEGPG